LFGVCVGRIFRIIQKCDDTKYLEDK
jgi:hypothetical protein